MTAPDVLIGRCRRCASRDCRQCTCRRTHYRCCGWRREFLELLARGLDMRGDVIAQPADEVCARWLIGHLEPFTPLGGRLHGLDENILDSFARRRASGRYRLFRQRYPYDRHALAEHLAQIMPLLSDEERAELARLTAINDVWMRGAA